MLPECVPGGDLNGDVVEFPGAMSAHRTTVHNGFAMVFPNLSPKLASNRGFWQSLKTHLGHPL